MICALLYFAGFLKSLFLILKRSNVVHVCEIYYLDKRKKSICVMQQVVRFEMVNISKKKKLSSCPGCLGTCFANPSGVFDSTPYLVNK